MRAIFGAAVLIFSTTLCSSQEAIDQAKPRYSSDIGFSSVAAALEAVRAVDGANVAEQEGWISIEDDSTGVILWTFTRPGNPSHPTAVKRLVAESNGDVLIEMRIRCEAPTSACQDLVRDFESRNAQLRADLVRRIQQRKLRTSR
jgi:hypothetical protein